MLSCQVAVNQMTCQNQDWMLTIGSLRTNMISYGFQLINFLKINWGERLYHGILSEISFLTKSIYDCNKLNDLINLDVKRLIFERLSIEGANFYRGLCVLNDYLPSP